MVADDLGGSSQSEDPLPRIVDNAHSSIPSPSPSQETSKAPGFAASAAGDVSAGRVPLWNRLPRSIWLMSPLAVANFMF